MHSVIEIRKEPSAAVLGILIQRQMVLRFHASGAASWGLVQKNTEYNICADEVNKSFGLLKPFYYQLTHIMLKNTELLKHSKITLQHVSVYIETIFRELQSVLG